MSRRYSVRVRYAMETFIEVEADNGRQAENKAMYEFDESYNLNAPDPNRQFVEREDVGPAYEVEEANAKQAKT